MEIDKPLRDSAKKIMKANQHSKMNTSGGFFHLNEKQLREKCSQYCSIGRNTLDKLIDGDYRLVADQVF